MSLLNSTTTATIANNVSNFTFDAVDYSVFIVMLGISASIGVYFGFFAKGADTTDEYLMGGRKMKTIPIAISLVASQLSGISIMTIPAEMYAFGMAWYFNVLSMIFVVPVLCWIVIPVFYNNNISNCYEYLESRFNRKTRQLLTLGFVGTFFFMLPVVIFIPALAFSQVTGVNIHLINSIVCSICVFYTMFGGIKAVVWTDVVQACIMVVSVILVGILGAIKVGGFGEVFKIAAEGQRLNVDFTFDATTRSTFWNNSLTALVAWTSYVGFNQSCVQRIVSLPTLGHAKRSLVFFGFGFIVILSMTSLAGIIMYARYHDCDPISAGFVSKADKLMPYFVQDVVGHLRGMPGVFISCVFSAALSTMSASLNSLSGVVYFDYIKPHIKHTETKANLIMKGFIFCAGVYCIFGGFVVEKFTSILQMTYSIGGITFGSVFGVFLLGMLVPKAHGRAAFWSVVISMTTMFIIIAGAQGRLSYKTLPLSSEGCPNANMTLGINSTLSTVTAPTTLASSHITDKPFSIFEISFNWYVVLGAAIVFVTGTLLSFALPPENDKKLNPKQLSPIVQGFYKYELANTEDEDLSEFERKKKEANEIVY